ncbi:MAG TPA: hypothetical protein VLA61_09230 [Ideonella sp.]|uniref:hypothetical protein n=1 Tax=Ideonella sp. TaxID=1929293 RepID=UPI002C2CE254|nr:hypothetical protein [Ideonella sp.]HSI48438.1 hypothetical protein [Ideonella sp.]
MSDNFARFRFGLTNVLRAVLCGGALAAAPIAAHAYLDPGSGSLIFQSLLAVVFGIGVGLRVVKTWLRGKWNSLSRRGRADEDDAAE